MNCEQCGNVIQTAYSMLVVLQKSDSTSGSSFFQCDTGTEYNTLTYQHWCDDKNCMKTKVASCINSHFAENSLTLDPNVNFHKAVLKAGLSCKVCSTALSSTAYRFCLTLATPVNSVPDNSLSDFGEWCCSLAHAQQSALAIVNGL